MASILGHVGDVAVAHFFGHFTVVIEESHAGASPSSKVDGVGQQLLLVVGEQGQDVVKGLGGADAVLPYNALALVDEDVGCCRVVGEHGLQALFTAVAVGAVENITAGNELTTN